MANITDYENILVASKWDLEKAACLLDDICPYFECPDLDYPPRNKLTTIRIDYKPIAVKLGLLDDLIDKLTASISTLL